MFRTSITRRFIIYILLVITIALSCLGFYLLHYFHENTMQHEQEDLLQNARIIEATLSEKLRLQSPEISTLAESISRETSLRITILTPDGQVLADTSEPAETLDNHLQREEVQQAMESGSGSSVRYSHTLHENLMYTAIPVYHDNEFVGVIRTATSLASVEQTYQQIQHSILIAILLAIIAALILAVWLAYHQLRPLRYLIRTAKLIAHGDLSRRIHLNTGDEFTSLGRSINKLTSALTKKIKEAEADAQKFSLILGQMDNAVMLMDHSGNICEANAKACSLFHIHPSDLPHHSIHLIDNASLSEKARSLVDTNESDTIIIEYLDHTFEVFLSSFLNVDEPSVLCVFHDISVLQELNRRQAEFTGNAAHELATPLTSISGFAELLREDDFSAPEESRHYADVIYQQAQRMNRLLQDLLQLTRLENKTYRSQLQLSYADGGALLQEALHSLEEQASEKRLNIIVKELAANAKIYAAPNLLHQVLRNLIDNAIKYTPEQGTITLSCSVEQSRVIYEIRDSGIGIPQDALPRIFDRFYRVDKARDRKTGGNGIGLSLVKFLTELFDGTVKAESTLGRGSVFILSFPLAGDESSQDNTKR